MNELTGQEIMQQLDRWITICETDCPGDYHRALVDFRNLINREGPYAVPEMVQWIIGDQNE